MFEDMSDDPSPSISRSQKLIFAAVACTLLCLLFPVAAPLFFSLFVGVAVRESGLENVTNLIGETFLYGATFFFGLTLGVLCEGSTLLEPTVLKLLLLGMLALLISALGGILGGYILYFATGGKFNPMIGIAGVSCVPTTAKVVQTPTPRRSSCRKPWAPTSAALSRQPSLRVFTSRCCANRELLFLIQ